MSGRRSKPVSRALLGVLLAAIVLAGGLYALLGGGGGASGDSAGYPSASNGPATQTSTAPTATGYYLAMGDSLAMGVGAQDAEHDYVSLIYKHEAKRYGDLRLENLGCGGATTKTVVYGPGCGAGTQLGDAEEFLRAHRGHVAFVTIDIGGNDLIACVDAPAVNQRCVEGALAAVAANLPKTLGRLRAAAPGVRVYGMDYYDPYLADWLSGLTGEATAEETLDAVERLNSELGRVYAAAGAPMADPAGAFRSRDYAMTGSYMGSKLPQNVADVCSWTNMCPARNVHTNDSGHEILATAFESLIDREPATLAQPAAPPASRDAGAPPRRAGG